MTRQEKDHIRGWWRHKQLRFMADGSVQVRSGPGTSWVVLYTPDMTRRHIEAARDQGLLN